MDYSKWDKVEDPEEEVKEELDYNVDSDGEPPWDDEGDIKTIVKKSVYKEIVRVGEGETKPGIPYRVKVRIQAYLNPEF